MKTKKKTNIISSPIPSNRGVWWSNMCCNHMAPAFTKLPFDFFPTVTCTGSLWGNNNCAKRCLEKSLDLLYYLIYHLSHCSVLLSVPLLFFRFFFSLSLVWCNLFSNVLPLCNMSTDSHLEVLFFHILLHNFSLGPLVSAGFGITHLVLLFFLNLELKYNWGQTVICREGRAGHLSHITSKMLGEWKLPWG